MKTKCLAVLALIGLIAVLSGCVGKPPKSEPSVVQAVFDTLSAPEMRGRRVGTAENVAAGKYIAQIFSEIGLAPLWGDSFACPYEQEVFCAEKADPRLTAHLADGSQRELKLGSEFNFSLRDAPIDLTLSVTYDLNDPALADKIYVDKAMADVLQPSGAIFDILVIEPGQVNAQGTGMVGPRRLWIEKGALQELLDAGLTAFSVFCRDTKMSSAQNNYIGVIRGQDSTRAVIIGAHFDGVGGDGDIFSPGAIDNASGVATMLGAAQLLSAGDQPAIDVVVCAFNGEEGSRRYGAEAVASDLSAFYEGCYYINVDCVGLADNKTYQYRASGNRPLEEAFGAALQAAGYFISDGEGAGDWTSFDHAGVAAVALAQKASGIHTTADRPEAVDVKALQGLAAFLADFIRSSGDNVYAQDSSLAQNTERKAVAQRQRLVDSLDLGFHDSYMYEFAGYYVCISGNRPVHTADELKAVYPWIEVRETLGPYQLQEVLAIDAETNRPFEINDMRIRRNVGPNGTRGSMPLDEVVHIAPGALDDYYFVYQDSAGACLGLNVTRLSHEGHWESLLPYCVPLVLPSGQAVPNAYYLPWGDNEEVGFVNYYMGGNFYVQISAYDTSRPMDDFNGYGNYTCDIRLLSQQEAAEIVEQLGLSGLEDYFSALLRGPDDA